MTSSAQIEEDFYGWLLAQASALALIMLLIMTPVVVLYWYVVRRRGILAAG